MLDYLLERLGKNPDTINYLMSSNEIALRELQLKIDKSLTSAPDTEQLLKEFKQIAKKRNANIHNQFIWGIQGRIKEDNGEKKEAIECYKRALSMTECSIWDTTSVYSLTELKLLFLVAKLNKDYGTVFEMEKYLAIRDNQDILKRYMFPEILYLIATNAPIDEKYQIEYIEKAIEYKKQILQSVGLDRLLREKSRLKNDLSEEEKKILQIGKTVSEVRNLEGLYGRI